MKRKWIVLAAVPLVVGLFFAKRLADKRPRLVARSSNAARAITVSPDGSLLFSRPPGGWPSQVVPLDTESWGDIHIVDGAEPLAAFFTPDNKRICQLLFKTATLGTTFPYRGATFLQAHPILSTRDASNGAFETRFVFPVAMKDFYGAYARGNEIIAEARQTTWRLDARDLHLKATLKRKRALTNARLCPDGKTLYYPAGGQFAWAFADLESEQILWRNAQVDELQFSPDGRTLLQRVGGVPGEVAVYDTRTGQKRWRLRGPQSWVVAVSPDQSAVYEARNNGELWKWPR